MRISDWSSDVCSSDLRDANTMGMQDQPLLVTGLIDHAACEHATREIVTRWADGSMTRSTLGEVGIDARRFAAAMVTLEIGSAPVWTPVTNAHLICRLLLAKRKPNSCTSNNSNTDTHPPNA